MIKVGSTVIATIDQEFAGVKRGEKYTVTEIFFSPHMNTTIFRLKGLKNLAFANKTMVLKDSCFEEVVERAKND